MPVKQSTVPAPARANPQLPALNGRSVRNLRHLVIVRAVRRNVAIVAAVFVAVLGASYGVPAYAQAVNDAAAPVVQTFAVAAVTPSVVLPRDGYTVTDPPPLQWPLGPGTPISDGFGPRIPPCAACSSFHEGVDFDPGYGAPVHAIAAGVVVTSNNSSYGGLGVSVAIQHQIGGRVVTSVYGHLQSGSMTLKVGDIVRVGQVLGLVGSTGASTGAHLHFEILLGGTTPVNPLPWMHARLG
ncbi:MAG: M23 family metallopeptidase [Lacisediminihabitans sp.]